MINPINRVFQDVFKVGDAVVSVLKCHGNLQPENVG